MFSSFVTIIAELARLVIGPATEMDIVLEYKSKTVFGAMLDGVIIISEFVRLVTKPVTQGKGDCIFLVYRSFVILSDRRERRIPILSAHNEILRRSAPQNDNQKGI